MTIKYSKETLLHMICSNCYTSFTMSGKKPKDPIVCPNCNFTHIKWKKMPPLEGNMTGKDMEDLAVLLSPLYKRIEALEQAHKDAENSEHIVKEEPKKIDMSMMVGSDIDCGFWGDAGYWFVDSLKSINSTQIKYKYQSLADGSFFSKCIVRQDHWFYSPDGWNECPIPEGLKIEYVTEDWRGITDKHLEDGIWEDTIAFRVLGVADGWEY